MSPHSDQSRLESEIFALLDNTLPPDRARVLHDRLEQDAGARDLYYQCVALHQALDFRFANAMERRSANADNLVRLQQRKAVRRSLAAAALILLGVGIVFWLRNVPAPEALATLRSSPGTLMAVRSEDGLPRKEGTLDKGAVVEIEQGVLELNLASGSRAIIQAPASFTLVDGTRLHLRRGSARFQIAKADHGFTVTTPTLAVRDLGTSFGVRVFPDKLNAVHVFDGKVEATGRIGLKKSETLLAGQAREVDPGGRLNSVTAEPGAFLAELPASLPDLWFSFDKSTGPKIPVAGSLPNAPDIAAEYHDAAGNAVAPALVPGRVGRAIALKGDGDFVQTDWPGIAGDLPRTVSFWTKVEAGTAFTNLPGVANWGDASDLVGRWKVMLAQEREDSPAVARISIGGLGYDGHTALNDGAWHHVAVTYRGDVEDSYGFSIYVDGEAETLTRREFYSDPEPTPRTRVFKGATTPLLIGKSLDPREGSFPGLLDELRIHAGALSAEAVRELFEAGAKSGN